MIKISPSILSADFANLAHEIKNLEDAGADMIHIDVMDANFVPNLTMGPPIIKALRKYTKLPFDVHLMITKPELSIDQYADAGADIITIHPEATLHLDRTISQIKGLGVKAGLAFLPTTRANLIEYIIEKIDMVLVMSVNPRFGGQSFMHNQLPKIQQLAAKLEPYKNIILSVDGGIEQKTAQLCKQAGANCLVSGNYIFSGNYSERISALKNS